MRGFFVTWDERIQHLSATRLTAIVILTALMAIIPAWMNFDIISRDGAFQYIPTAMLYHQGDFAKALSQPQLPMFPLLIALLVWITGLDFELAGRLVAATAFLVAATGLFRLTEYLTRKRWAACMALLFFLSNRIILDTAVDCLQESLQLSFVIWGNYAILVFLDKDKPGRYSYLVLGGLLFLLGAAVRTTTLIFPFAWFVLWVFHKREGFWLRLGGTATVMVIGVAFVIINHDLPLFHMKKGFQIYTYLSMAPDLPGKLGNFPETLRLFFFRGHPAAMILAVFALASGLNRAYRWHAALVTVLFLTMFFIMGWTTQRYIQAPIVWLYPAAAWMAVVTLNSKQKVLRWLVILTIISCPIMWAGKVFTPPDPGKVALKNAAHWILAYQGPGKALLTNRDRLAFYSRARYTPLETPQDLQIGRVIVALDLSRDGAQAIKDMLDKAGVTPDMTIRTICIYLPKPRSIKTS